MLEFREKKCSLLLVNVTVLHNKIMVQTNIQIFSVVDLGQKNGFKVQIWASNILWYNNLARGRLDFDLYLSDHSLGLVLAMNDHCVMS